VTFISVCTPFPTVYRVTSCPENLEMSVNLTALWEMSGNLPKVVGKILSGKLFIVNIWGYTSSINDSAAKSQEFQVPGEGHPLCVCISMCS